MLFQNIFLALTATLWTSSIVAKPIAKRDFGPVTIFTPPSSYVNEKTLYGRSLMLKDGTLLSTWENYDWSEQPWFPVYRSTDHGFTWNPLSNVTDQVNGWGMRYQPFLYLLDTAIGGYPVGTILCAGNSIPSDLSKTQIDLYASTDNGTSWKFVSHIANGGKAVPDNGETPVWEPFLMTYKGQLVVYYSDQRDPKYGQKLVHQVTSDMKTWGSVVNDVIDPVYSRRPGMPVISKMSNGKYFLTYENIGSPIVNGAVTYKIASNPLAFGSATAVTLNTTDGHVPAGSPYNVWTSIGSSQGTVVVNANSDTDFFINHNYGVGSWTRISTSAAGAYSRSLAVGYNPKDILIVSGGALGQGSTNKVLAYARDVNGCASCS